MNKHYVLASQSPRRRELMNQMGVLFTTVSPKVDETLRKGDSLEAALENLAVRKAENVLDRYPENVIIAADTLVVLNGKLMGKPKDEEDARRMLKALSGKVHQVITAVCIMDKNHHESFHSITEVEFYDYQEDLVNQYVSSRQAFDKAGAYGIQDKGALFIKAIRGDYYTVMGLPIGELYQRLQKFKTVSEK